MANIPVPDNKAETKLQVDLIKPFENIALAFSGGGFRAASFSLGVLSYLDKVIFTDDTDELNGQTLLHQVRYLSSASGGTITTTLYALYNAQGKTFGQFYTKLFTGLSGDDLLQHALEILADKKRWDKRPQKSRNIINAFSLAYDEFLFDGSTLQSLIHQVSDKAHLQEVCFNATEFYTGQSFRQNVKLVPDNGTDKYFNYGNEVIFVDKDTAGKIKLGDILAASSCFPAGFEPIIYPNDYAHQEVTEQQLRNALTLIPQTGDKQESDFIKRKQFGLMDGGITDNQGLQSMMEADGRRLNRQSDFPFFELMLVNDVGSHYIQPYELPKVKKGFELNLWGVFFIAAAFLAGAIALTWWGACHHCIVATIAGALLVPVPLIWVSTVLYVRYQLFTVSKSSMGVNLQRNFTIDIIRLLVGYFTKTPVSVLKQMLTTRAQSVLMLNTSIFLKRIRQLLYDKFYGTAQWKNRGKGNHVYDLSFSNDINRKQGDTDTPVAPSDLDPSEDIQIVTQTAFNMGTTLWFDKKSTEQEHCEACLIACGQFTTCYNLLEYIDRLLAQDTADAPYDPKYQNRLLKLRAQMMDDYNHFKTDPFFLYNDSGTNYQIPGFINITMFDIPFPENWKEKKQQKPAQ
ncbi:patatin-like phospholipase family protein [Mucilaginibacter sp. SP1R1]|uniref:patatin-like phospholipase family protein n=1 Tax=Mucilaginibacter sp. SP1R1 TaxID=2723091 RepID=UPI00160F6FCA|nr:patatin-like phospholipase family protein [Mucilaginibacter sp. SP1R1]MBB6152459.1 putative acylesterase/phospholipase RssA [Mucilaginibacter sp. SP1R1]